MRCKGFRHAAQRVTRNARYVFNHFGRVGAHEFADLVHAVNALGDELVILPAVFKDVPHDAPDDGNIGAGAHTDKFGGMGGRAGEARVDDNDIRPLRLFALKDVLQRDGVRLGGIGAHEDNGLGVADIVVAVGLCAVAPGVGHARHCGRMADARLMVDVVGAPERRELAEQIGAFVREFGRTQQIDAVGAAGFADVLHLGADFVQRLLP